MTDTENNETIDFTDEIAENILAICRMNTDDGECIEQIKDQLNEVIEIVSEVIEESIMEQIDEIITEDDSKE